MNILVDADACPVKNIIIRLAKDYHLPVTMVIDNTHILQDNYCEIIIVDKARDSVDLALINKVQKGDIVVSQDYGVAAMALAKECFAISNHGLVFDKDNIDRLLFERHISQKIRKAGGKTSNPKKRTHEDNIHFEKQFRRLIELAINKEEC